MKNKIRISIPKIQIIKISKNKNSIYSLSAVKHKTK